MRRRLLFSFALAALVAVAGILAAARAFSQAPIVSAPTYVPDTSHEDDPLSGTTLAWDATMKTTNVPADTENAYFTFYFTNVTARPVTVLDAEPSCQCTSTELPPLPWTIQPGTNAQIGVIVDLEGKFGTVVKSVRFSTDKGSRDLIVQINILEPVVVSPSEAQRMEQMRVAKIDRQAVFKNNCATCHVKPGEDRYGRELYHADCAICHEAKNRASMVPDLHHLKVPTNESFWHVWIAHGKPGTFMPAFSMADGGPLTDMQISSLAAYLDEAIPATASSNK
jgi:cytochrome c553